MNDQNTPAPQKRAGPRHKRESRRKVGSYSVPIKVRAAFLAGQGKSASQIADALGVAQPHLVRGLLRTLGIPLLPDSSTHELITIRLERAAVDAMSAMADRAGTDPVGFAARIITMMVIHEPTVLRNLLEEASAHEQA